MPSKGTPCQPLPKLRAQLSPGVEGGEAEGERAAMKLNDYPRPGNNSPAGGGSTLNALESEEGFSQETAEMRNSCKVPAGRVLFYREAFDPQTQV